MPLNQSLYDRLQEAGFQLKFKPTVPDGDGKIKGNVDADLVLQAMIDFPHYEKAVLVSSDGDFYSLVRYLSEKGKLLTVISSDVENCSGLLKQTAGEKMRFMDNLRNKLEYKRKSTA
ncbi:MAG: NYN domain-containing protein [Patescibacteria group bacterium]